MDDNTSHFEEIVDNYSINYFIALTVKQSAKAKGLLLQYTCTLLGLMHSATGKLGTENNNENKCPPLYVQGLFIQGFGDVFYSSHFDWLLRSDPVFGSDSYGQSARLYSDRVYLMHRDFQMLVENYGWNALPAFAPFLNAVTNIPDLGDETLADRNYFVEAPSCFVKHYKEMFGKHVAKNVLTNDIVIYLIGGNATLAWMLLNWLVVAAESSNIDSYIFSERAVSYGLARNMDRLTIPCS